MSAAAEPHLLVERDGPVMILTMNNPRRRNALTPPMLTLMAQAWEGIDNDDTIRVAIITGAGSSYCVGGDLADGWMVKGVKNTHGSAEQRPKSGGSVISEGLLLTRSLTKPLIAAVNGACLGGGCEMLQQNDIRVAAEAYHFGLVGHVVPTGSALAKAGEIAAPVAANGPLAVRNAKASILKSGWLDEEDARKIEQRFVVEVMRSSDAREGLAAFADKREPRFTGE